MFGSFGGLSWCLLLRRRHFILISPGGPGTSAPERGRNTSGFYGGSPQRRMIGESSRTVTVRGCDLTENSLRRTFGPCGSIQQLNIDERKK